MSGWSGAQSLHAEQGKAVVYAGMIDCMSRTVREEGMKALFKVGLAPALIALNLIASLAATAYMQCSSCIPGAEQWKLQDSTSSSVPGHSAADSYLGRLKFYISLFCSQHRAL